MAPKRRGKGGPASFWDEKAVVDFIATTDFKAEVVTKAYCCVCKALRELPVDAEDPERGIWLNAESLAERAYLKKAVLPLLRSKFGLFSSKIKETHESIDGDTTKSVVELHDGHRVEAVAMRHENYNGEQTRTTICVSSQVGCQMGCQFCATGTLGIIGDLSCAEIVEQFALATVTERLAGRAAPKNVVFMGMGEPLANYEAVKNAVLMFTDHLKLGKKSVTVSTVGVVPAMRKLARDLPEVRLALSLHAPTQAIRERIVPAAKAWPMPALISALDEHLASTRKLHQHSIGGMMIEYVLLRDVNDSDQCAEDLANLLEGRNVMLNIIPYNPNITAEMHGFLPPSEERCRVFGKHVIDRGIRVRLRREMGQDIAAACGQLALVQPASQKKDEGETKNGLPPPAPDIEELLFNAGTFDSDEEGLQRKKEQQPLARRKKKKEPKKKQRPPPTTHTTITRRSILLPCLSVLAVALSAAIYMAL